VAALLEPVPLSATTFERREEVAEGARRRLLDLGAPGLVTASLNRVAMLIPEGVEPRRVFQGLPSDRLAFVVARPVCGVDAVQHSFSEVVTVLPHITEPGLVPLEHLLLPRVLQGDEDAQRALVDKYLTRLLERRGGEALAKTLAALPSEAFHLGRVSRSLGIHISTLRHRLERIEALLEISLQDPKTRIEIGIASILSDKM
jgi:purine catabolism regulator